jgi:EAL domain-containing protein (putative c-di-GMP-specific phosphodiesterase class I)
MMLLPGTHSSDDTRSIAEKVLASMAVPFDLEGREYHISISIGISRYPEDGLDAETLIKHADIAMYQAKEQGRNTYSSFSENLTQKISRKVGLENDLRDALRHDQLELHYQPQKNLIIDRWYVVDALLRWRHPEKGMIPPDEFIGIAEETGLIVKIGDWVLRRAAEQYLAWRAAGIDVGPLSVNLSPHQFLQSNLVERIRAILHETGMPSTQLGIEVTESAAMPNFQHSIRTMESLRDMGIAIYIDDFGTGFSSLSHLRHLPIDALKIDRAFIDELPHNADDVAIAQAIIAMAKTLNLRIIAEGVETPAQLDFLKRHGCHSAQGFFLSRPVPAERISELLGASQQA